MRLLVLALVLVAFLSSSSLASAPSTPRARVHAAPARGVGAGAVPSVVRAICATFGRYCGEALRVAWCESRWKVSARNGTHLGLFQMGAWERRTYGHGPGAWAQSRAAYRYFTALGHSWRRWTCQP